MWGKEFSFKLVVPFFSSCMVECVTCREINSQETIIFFRYWKVFLLDPRQWVPIRSVLLLIIGLFVGWLVGWLVGNAVLSERALSIFLIFYIKLEDYEGRKVTKPDFWKKTLICRYLRKDLQISPKSDTDIFLKSSSNNFFGFWPDVSTN